MIKSPLRCATYARYSTDMQKEASIVDQQRVFARHADALDWQILPEYTFADEGHSGSGLDRPGLQALLNASRRKPRMFDVLLVDDTSRISRSLADAVRISEQLKFNGIRLIAVSQGIDSDNEQSDVMMTVHGLVDSLYIKELAKKTHRGLEGRALQGLHTGGACFGYDIVPSGDSKRLAVNPEEAKIVVRIFQLSAAGVSLKKIATQLNADRVPPPRGSKNTYTKAWVFTCVREMLRRELYVGQIIWNKRKYTKRPGTNKRVSTLRPREEWIVTEDPSLRIVTQELWNRVQDRLAVAAAVYPGPRPGLRLRSESAPYLFSGILKCGVCGGNLVIVGGRGTGERMGYYGCAAHAYRGVCSNALTQRRDEIEAALLSGIQDAVRTPASINHVVNSVVKALQSTAPETSKLTAKVEQLKSELANLTDAIAKSGGSAALITALQQKEREFNDTQRRVGVEDACGARSYDLARLRKRVEAELSDLPALLNEDLPRARAEILRHVSEITMTPGSADGAKAYVAEGEWDLLPELPQKAKVTGAMLNGDFQDVAGRGFEPPTFGL